MYADVEALVLSGELFNNPARSPTRSPSPDAGWHDEEISPETKRRIEQGYDSDSDNQQLDSRNAKDSQMESIGMGPGRTGVKGVIRDRDEAEALEKDQRSREVDEIRKRIEASHLGGKTFLEEEREKALSGVDGKVDPLVIKELEVLEERRKDVLGKKKDGKFGHLREVGARAFVTAVEEERAAWVVVHLYDPSLERCYHTDDTLSRLARLHPDTKFLRARASALGFTSTTSRSRLQFSRLERPRHREEDDDDDDPYDEKNYEDDGDQDVGDEDNVDLDMLPTMLVYRHGDLMYNWVRVDWEAGQAGIEELLHRHQILSYSRSILSSGGLGSPSDDEDDLDLLFTDVADIDHLHN